MVFCARTLLTAHTKYCTIVHLCRPAACTILIPFILVSFSNSSVSALPWHITTANKPTECESWKIDTREKKMRIFILKYLKQLILRCRSATKKIIMEGGLRDTDDETQFIYLFICFSYFFSVFYFVDVARAFVCLFYSSSNHARAMCTIQIWNLFSIFFPTHVRPIHRHVPCAHKYV